PKLREAEVWVLATPVFVDGISGPMKDLLDRFIPLIQPFVELRDGHCRHPLREGTERGKLVGSPTAASGSSTTSTHSWST
ncbi:NAD(P)H-dependent oxidoreductase, partial [Gemmatimonadota bacterium]